MNGFVRSGVTHEFCMDDGEINDNTPFEDFYNHIIHKLDSIKNACKPGNKLIVLLGDPEWGMTYYIHEMRPETAKERTARVEKQKKARARAQRQKQQERESIEYKERKLLARLKKKYE